MDIQFFYFINHFPHNFLLDAAMRLVSWGAYVIPVILIIRTVWKNKEGRGRRVIILVALYALGYLLVEGLKIAVSRPRPFLTLPDVTTVGSLSDSYSFPSGHTALAFLTAALFRKKWLWIFAVFVGISRIYLGVHYPADVTFGAISGIIYGLIIPKFLIH